MTPKHLCLTSILATITVLGACSSSGGDSPSANDAQNGETESVANQGQPAGGTRSTSAGKTTAGAASTQPNTLDSTLSTGIGSASSGEVDLVRNGDPTLGQPGGEALAEPGLEGSGQAAGASLTPPAVPIATDAKPQMLLLGVNDALELAARVVLACDLLTPEDSKFDKIVVSGGASRSGNPANPADITSPNRPGYLQFTEAILMESLLTKACITDVNWGPSVGKDCASENSADILKMRINGLFVDTWKYDQEVISKGSKLPNYEGSKRAIETFKRTFALDQNQEDAPADFYTLVFNKLDACASAVNKKIAGSSLEIVQELNATSTASNLCESFGDGSGKKKLIEVSRPLWVVSTHHHAYSTAACAALRYYGYDITKQGLGPAPVHAYYTCEGQNGLKYYDPKLDHSMLCPSTGMVPTETCRDDYTKIYDTCDTVCDNKATPNPRCTPTSG